MSNWAKSNQKRSLWFEDHDKLRLKDSNSALSHMLHQDGSGSNNGQSLFEMPDSNASGMIDQSHQQIIQHGKTPSELKKIEIKKALRRAHMMNRRWRNMGGGPHSSIGEY